MAIQPYWTNDSSEARRILEVAPQDVPASLWIMLFLVFTLSLDLSVWFLSDGMKPACSYGE